MNGWTFFTGSMILLILIFALLIYLAAGGNVTAGIVLGVVASITLITVGVALVLLSSWVLHGQEQRAFMSNAKENLGIMSAMQRVQNQQHSLMQRQALAALPRGEVVDGDALSFDARVFNDLDDEIGQ